MRQEYKYTVTELGPKTTTILEGKDVALIGSYRLGKVSSFNPDESRLDADIFDLEGNLLESHQDISDYAIRGVEQGKTKVNQLEVNPASFTEGRTFLGDIIVEYKAFDNAFSRNAELYISDISSDRTEVRAKSVTISTSDLRYYTNLLQGKLNNESYFHGAFMEVEGLQIPVINIVTEVVDFETVVTLKLYKALPAEIELKSRFQVLESLGESSQFRVHRELVVVEEEIPSLQGPNFEIDVTRSTIATDYKNYNQLLSQKSWESSKELYTTFKQAIQHTSVDYEDFSDFIHFSSAFERLENARYKFEKIFDYQVQLQEAAESGSVDAVKKIQALIDGLIENFDHYENYLWFESGSAAWPKKLDPETGTVSRPFVNVDHPYDVDNQPGYLDWYNNAITLAEGFDNNNKDILIASIPAAIREDLDHNEPYLMFVHMVAQHFDDLWIYARAITDRYNGDNRMEFGISKELVKDALEAFGVDLYETNQNLTAFFDLCQPDGTYDWGEELEGKDGQKSFIRVSDDPSWIEQPLLRENYTKEVYKRIYHNIPALLKMKGTSRGLRVLLNCFGIPNDILKFRVQGGTNSAEKPFFGPEETVNVFDENIDENGLVGSPSNSKKIRTGNKNEPILEYKNIDGTGSFFRSSTLSRYTSVTSSNTTFTDDSHKVEVGFDLNEAVNRFFEKNVEDFTVDDVIGDPRNREEHYGDAWRGLREALLKDVILPVDPTDPYEHRRDFRAPAAIIRLVRYFDSTFFRMLKDFLPARASIDSGVIVKDNLLHRNRWKGVTVTWEELTKSGSISGSTIYGSHGGSFRHAGYKFDTSDKYNVVSTGDRWVDKGVLSGSREINGELAGSVLKVTDGDLSKYNKHRKDLQPSNDLPYKMWFLDLPDPPLCTAKLYPEYLCEYWTFEVLGLAADSTTGFKVYGTELNEIETSLVTKQVYKALLEYPREDQTAEIARTHWTSLTGSGKRNVFLGWYNVPASKLYGNAITPGRKLYLEQWADRESPYHEWKACYTSSTNWKILWMEQLNPYQYDHVNYYYPDNDVLLAWKLLNRTENPATTPTEETGSVITSLGGMQVEFLISSTASTAEGQEGEMVADVIVPDEIYFGTNNGYYWAQGLHHSGSVVQYGIKSFNGNKTSPYVQNRTLVDATWFDSYDDWIGSYGGNWKWPITVGDTMEK